MAYRFKAAALTQVTEATLAADQDVNAAKIGGIAPTMGVTLTIPAIIGTSTLVAGDILAGDASKIIMATGKVSTPDTQKVDLNTIKAQTVTATTAVTFPTTIGTSTYAGGAADAAAAAISKAVGTTADKAAGAAGGLPILAATGTVQSDAAAALSAYNTSGVAKEASVGAIATILTGITSLAKWLGLIAGKTADAATLIEMNATTAGAGYVNTTDSLQAIADADVAAALTPQQVRDAMTLAPTIGTGAAGSIDADLDSILDDTGTSGVVVAAASKTGYSLAATGLDAITIDTPSGAIGTWNFRQRMVMLFRRFFGKAIKDTSTNTIRTYDGSTVLTTQTIAETSTSETQGEST
jgi:hypothetical protein